MRWEPFAIFFFGFLYISIIVYLSKPTLPSLNAVDSLQFQIEPKLKHLVFHPELLFTAKSSEGEICLQQQEIKSLQVDGKIQFMIPNPNNQAMIAIAYYTIYEETLAFYLSEVSLVGGKLSEVEKSSFPGHLGISDLLRGYDGKYLYKRKQDTRLFRIFDKKSSLPGPKFADFPGRLLAFAYLYSPTDSATVFAAQYLPAPNSKLFEVSFSLYTRQKSNDNWDRKLLWSVQLIGLGNNMIDADQVDYLYFLTKAVISTKPNGKLASFVFMEHLFTLIFNKDNEWELNTQPIVGLHGADYDVDIIHTTVNRKDPSDENLIVIIAEHNRCFVFSDQRMAEMGLFTKLRGQLGVYNDLILFILQEAFHLWLFPEDILELTSAPLPTSLIESNAQSNSSWNILGMWSPEFIHSDTVIS